MATVDLPLLCGSSARLWKADLDDVLLSKTLSYYLRHAPSELDLQLEPGGWVAVEDLLAGLVSKGFSTSYQDLERVVKASDKQRFALQGMSIRANQGHSVEVDLQLQTSAPPATLYHGTATRFLDSIQQQGLIPGQRHHVHLSAASETALQVGQRHGSPIVLEVRSGEMHNFSFYCSANGVWLVERVPPEFLRVLP